MTKDWFYHAAFFIMAGLLMASAIGNLVQSAALSVAYQRAKDFQAMPCGDR